ncbi:hypothetical protein [Streptomyces niveus]|uniref:hypothetical protein n=1 Tax=Streptomyces niveus TaxID=193462 RepID=UPI0034282F8F
MAQFEADRVPADQVAGARAVAVELPRRWQAHLAMTIRDQGRFRAMRAVGRLPASFDFDVDRSAGALLAGVQGDVALLTGEAASL